MNVNYTNRKLYVHYTNLTPNQAHNKLPKFRYCEKPKTAITL